MRMPDSRDTCDLLWPLVIKEKNTTVPFSGPSDRFCCLFLCLFVVFGVFSLCLVALESFKISRL